MDTEQDFVDEAGPAVEDAAPEPQLIDALPYFDRDMEKVPGTDKAIWLLLEEEKKAMRREGLTVASYLDDLPPIPKITDSTLVRTELNRIKMDKKAGAVLNDKYRRRTGTYDESRYSMPKPAKEQRHNVEAWKAAVDNANAQVEHQRNRARALELMSLYGTQLWKKRGGQMEGVEKVANAQLTALEEKVQEINWDRKTEQERIGGDLFTLETRWGELVSKNYEIERACLELESHIEYYGQQSASTAAAAGTPAAE